MSGILDDPYSKGWDTHMNGNPIENNPYENGSEDFRLWNEGWLDAEEDYEGSHDSDEDEGYEDEE